MSISRGHLRLVEHVEPDDSPPPDAPPTAVTDQVLDHLRAVTDITCGGGGFSTTGNVAVKPPHGVITVLIDGDGRPTPLGELHGLDDPAAVMLAAATGLQMLAAGRSHGDVHRAFDRTTAMRADQRARTEAALPFECSCGKRTATEDGLGQHQASPKCPHRDQHRERQEMS